MLRLIAYVIGWFAFGYLALIIEEKISPFRGQVCNNDGAVAVLFFGPISLIIVLLFVTWDLYLLICGCILAAIIYPFVLLVEGIKKIITKPTEGEKA